MEILDPSVDKVLKSFFDSENFHEKQWSPKWVSIQEQKSVWIWLDLWFMSICKVKWVTLGNESSLPCQIAFCDI